MTGLAAGKVITGFSLPYVALYHNTGGVVSYTGGRQLARGVKVNLSVETFDEKKFYADDVESEVAPSRFRRGTVQLGVDGLLIDAEKMILGLPSPSTMTVDSASIDVYDYGDALEIPYVGIAYIVRYQSNGIELFTPTLLTKARFAMPAQVANTQEEEIDFQTSDLSAALMRDDTTNHNWRRVAEDQETEAAALKIVKAFLQIGES